MGEETNLGEYPMTAHKQINPERGLAMSSDSATSKVAHPPEPLPDSSGALPHCLVTEKALRKANFFCTIFSYYEFVQ